MPLMSPPGSDLLASPAEEGAMDDHFDRLPDSVLLLLFNKIDDVKVLGRCCVVSRRFHSLASQVDNVLVRVDCVISDEDHHSNPPPTTSSASDLVFPASPSSSRDKPPRGLFSHLACLVLGGIIRPFQAIGQIIAGDVSSYAAPFKINASSPFAAASAASSSPSSSSITDAAAASSSEVSHHSPTEVLRNFKEIRRLRIELPTGELGVDDGVLLKWKADFGSTLNSCVILGASSVLPSSAAAPYFRALDDKLAGINAYNRAPGEAPEEGFCSRDGGGGGDDNGSIPESFYTNGSLKLRVVWTISSLIAASARHYLLQPIIADHETLESLDLTDANGQGVLQMDRRQLEELRVKPVSASGLSQRTLVPALNMRLWYADHLELSGGTVLKGATLVAIRPSENLGEASSEGVMAGGHETCRWVASAFEEEPYRSAVRQLVKRRMYCLEMNSF